jgi:hypothetical protein
MKRTNKFKLEDRITRIDDVDVGPDFASFCRACLIMEREGLDCFDEDGNYYGYDGEVIIEGIRERFESLEMYKDCAFLRDLLVQYKEKFRK